ncbi:MAG: hypothetical protein PCFJNLEI_04008 [Verrucomicrobiae bacterium]|nr:hypothetical protein [Verrucomicrobiae bacterium]
MSLILDKLAQVLNPVKPEALLIGGQALRTYGVIRQTLDVDCLAATDGAAKLEQALLAAGYTALSRSDTVVCYRHPSPILLDVDVVIVNPETFNKLQRDSRQWHAEQPVWRVPSLAHLIALKLHAIKNAPERGRDLPDIISLLRQNPNDLTRTKVQELCQQFGPPDVFSELEKVGIWKS